MSLLSLVTHFCERTNVPIVGAVMASTDVQIIQIRALLEEEGDDLAKRGEWESMTLEQSFTTVAAEDQGVFGALTNQTMGHIKNQTLWSHTRRLPVAGPLDARQWQALKALFVNGPYYQFRIRGGHLLVNPTPPAGESWFFEYVTTHWIVADDGTTYKSYFTADSDSLLVPEELALLGLRWRWKKEKGLDYAEDFRSYEMQVKDALGRDGGKPVLCMDAGMRQGSEPGIFVPQGSWQIP